VIEAGVRPDFGPGHSPVAGKGLDLKGMLYDGSSPIKAMYIVAENPVITFPESGKVESALKGLDFLVVQDIMLSDTAKLAHVVLPAASWSEKEGTLVGSAGVPQKAVKCLAETGLSVADWMIFRNLARAMQKPLGAETIEALREEIRAKVSFDFQAAAPSLAFNPVAYEESEAVDGEYPFVMVTGILMQHSGSLTAISKGLGSVVSDAYLQINDLDAKRLGVKDEGFVRVNSRRGEAYLKARVTDEVREGMLFAPAHFPHARVNALTMPATNGVHSAIAVKVEQV
jgi:predicted molibdopterin-dependent oxidoreductase YjgC